MRYSIIFRPGENVTKEEQEEDYGKRRRTEDQESDEEGERELKRIFKNKAASAGKKRVSSLPRNPFQRSSSKNTKESCYQYAAIHMFKTILKTLGYTPAKINEYMKTFNLDLVDARYIEELKPVYLQLFHDPEEDYIKQISLEPFESDEDYVSVRSRITNITDEYITFSYYHPYDQSSRKEIKKNRSDLGNILEDILHKGLAYEYLVIMLDILSELDLIDQKQILALEEDPKYISRLIGMFIRLKFIDFEARHVVSVVRNENFEMVSNNETHVFKDYKSLIEYLERTYEIDEVQNVFLIEKEIEDYI